MTSPNRITWSLKFKNLCRLCELLTGTPSSPSPHQLKHRLIHFEFKLWVPVWRLVLVSSMAAAQDSESGTAKSRDWFPTLFNSALTTLIFKYKLRELTLSSQVKSKYLRVLGRQRYDGNPRWGWACGPKLLQAFPPVQIFNWMFIQCSTKVLSPGLQLMYFDIRLAAGVWFVHTNIVVRCRNLQNHVWVCQL